jgi:predicted short-subunit dehydrogenase-like oxidoreductase (DUF2520 family)
MKKQVSIAVIGKGKVGTSFARAISRNAGFRLFAHLSARASSFAGLSKNGGPEVIFIAAKDSGIKRVSKKVIRHAGENLQLLVHSAGSLAPDILPLRKNVSRLTLHPIQTFPVADAKLLDEIYWMASSKSKEALRFAKRFTRSLGAEGVIEVEGSKLPLYHLLTVFASNFPVLLGAAIEKFSKMVGVNEKTAKKAIAPLMKRSVENVLANSAKEVLTGPFARKDFSTILKHRYALRRNSPALRKIYEGFFMLSQELSKK